MAAGSSSRAARSLLKEAVHGPASSASPATERSPARPWQNGVSKRPAAKSAALSQQRVERYHQVHDLHSKKADGAAIARQLGMARRTV